MIYSPRVCKAMKLAFYAHVGQSDKGDYPYFAHPLHLAEQCLTESETIVALLHDVLEDTEKTAAQMMNSRRFMLLRNKKVCHIWNTSLNYRKIHWQRKSKS